MFQAGPSGAFNYDSGPAVELPDELASKIAQQRPYVSNTSIKNIGDYVEKQELPACIPHHHDSRKAAAMTPKDRLTYCPSCKRAPIHYNYRVIEEGNHLFLLRQEWDGIREVLQCDR